MTKTETTICEDSFCEREIEAGETSCFLHTNPLREDRDYWAKRAAANPERWDELKVAHGIAPVHEPVGSPDDWYLTREERGY